MNVEQHGGVFVYIGSYTRKSNVGIHLYSFDLINGTLRYVEGYSEIPHPSFLTIDQKNSRLYVVSETMEYNGTHGGSVASYDIDSSTGRLTYRNQQPTYGGAPCYVSLDHSERCLFTANYMGGSVSLFPILKNGAVGKPVEIVKLWGSSIHPIRQNAPHAHSIQLDPLNRFAIVTDLGSDKLWVYEFDCNGHRLVLKNEITSTPGSGPRHFVFHPVKNYVYVINELDSTITSFLYIQENGTFLPFQSVSTLSSEYHGDNTCADIHLSKDGKFLYASNRGQNTITVYAVHDKDGSLHFVEQIPTGGLIPRNFAISPEDRYIVVANQDSDNVCVFKRDRLSGVLQKTGSVTDVSQPACVKIISFK